MTREKENHFGNNGRKSPESCKPVGPLASVFADWETPEDCQRRITRRIGAWAGTLYLPIPTIQGDIEDSTLGRGLPDWPVVERVLADRVRNLYRKSKTPI